MGRSASTSVPASVSTSFPVPGARTRGSASASVREVCLVASARPSQAWAAGERVTWSGRLYRVEATQDPSGPGPDADGATGYGYVYLSPLPAGDV